MWLCLLWTTTGSAQQEGAYGQTRSFAILLYHCRLLCEVFLIHSAGHKAIYQGYLLICVLVSCFSCYLQITTNLVA